MPEDEKAKLRDYYKGEARKYTQEGNELRAKNLEQILQTAGIDMSQQQIFDYLNGDFDEQLLSLIEECPNVLGSLTGSLVFNTFGELMDKAKKHSIHPAVYKDLNHPEDDSPRSEQFYKLLSAPIEFGYPLLKDNIAIIRAQTVAHAQTIKENPIPFLKEEFYLSLAEMCHMVGLDYPQGLEFKLGKSGMDKLQRRENAKQQLEAVVMEGFTSLTEQDMVDGGSHPKIAERGAKIEINKAREGQSAYKELLKEQLKVFLEKMDDFIDRLLDVPDKAELFK